jgi:hypothetical protein
LNALKRVLYLQEFSIQVHVSPAQSEQLSPSHACREGQDIERLEAVALRGIEKALSLRGRPPTR